MNISGKSSIAGKWLADENAQVFQSFLAGENESSSQDFINASSAQIGQAACAAEEAFWQYSALTRVKRAEFLELVAENILDLGDGLITVTQQETGLSLARLQGERMRTVNQLKLFANQLRDHSADVIDELAEPNRQPLPKPATRLEYLAVGPVAVFGASNFPYAFSVLGGDTASALAAGCTVVVKGHPAHPSTSEMMATAINQAIAKCNLPAGVFSLIQGSDPNVSHELVKHPAIKAVGFTGSLAVAKLLQVSIATREEPIPFYGELGSINPQLVFQDKLQNQSSEMAEALIQSLMMGQGQFCTSPGLWVIPTGNQAFLTEVAHQIQKQSSDVLLTQGILSSYSTALRTIADMPEVQLIGKNTPSKSQHPSASIYKVTATTFNRNSQLKEEIFGPYALVVEYANEQELFELVANLEGQLTASLHGEESDLLKAKKVIERLKHKVGRLIFNQMPTGVEVCASMNHGGPYPASTDVRTTSVGTKAMDRFLRPLCVQNTPTYLK